MAHHTAAAVLAANRAIETGTKVKVELLT
jgi:hypothetical protein